MNTLVNGLDEPRYARILASFGPARLIELRDGRAELRGGTGLELAEAKEWISLFEHDRVLRMAPPANARN